MIKKIVLILLTIGSLFAKNVTDNLEGLYNEAKTKYTAKLTNNKHTLIISFHMPKKIESAFELLNNKEKAKKYLLTIETKQNLSLCAKPNIYKITQNNKNKLIFQQITTKIKYNTFINKTSCEYIYKKNSAYKKDFYKQFNNFLNDFVKQLKNNGYFKKIDDLQRLKITMKYIKQKIPYKLDNLTLVYNVDYNINKKEINYYYKLLHKPENKTYQTIIKLAKANKLKTILRKYLVNNILHNDNEKYLKNLILNKHWTVKYHYNIQSKEYLIII